MQSLINNMNNLKIKEERFCTTSESIFSYPDNYSPKFCISVKFPKSIIIDLPNIKTRNGYEKVIPNNEILERSKDEVVNEKISNIKKGDIIEEWVYNLLCKSDQLINVENVGRDNGKLDIIFQVKDEVNKNNNQFRGIQVKQLRINGKNNYCIRELKKYGEDTLIVGVSEDKKYMCLILNTYIGNLDSFCFSINDYKNKKYIDYIFAGLEDNSLGYTFFNKLIEYCKISTICSASQFSETNLKEYKMMKILKEKCIENGLVFKSCDTADSPIDVYINEKKVQCKYSNSLHNNLYEFKLHHAINNKVNQPYSKNDVDFFIFKHENEDSFYIIPENSLIHFDFLTTKKSKGKIGILIAPLLYQGDHWTKQFADRFDLINSEYDLDKLKNLNNSFDKFQHKCKLNNIICTRDMANLSITNGFVNNKSFKLMTSKSKPENRKLYYFHTCIHNNNIKNPYYIEDLNIPDFFIFRIEDFTEDFYIIPKNILVEQEIIGIEDKKGKTTFGLPIPSDTKNQKQWVFEYLNNFDLLKDKKSVDLQEEI